MDRRTRPDRVNVAIVRVGLGSPCLVEALKQMGVAVNRKKASK